MVIAMLHSSGGNLWYCFCSVLKGNKYCSRLFSIVRIILFCLGDCVSVRVPGGVVELERSPMSCLLAVTFRGGYWVCVWSFTTMPATSMLSLGKAWIPGDHRPEESQVLNPRGVDGWVAPLILSSGSRQCLLEGLKSEYRCLSLVYVCPYAWLSGRSGELLGPYLCPSMCLAGW